MSYETEKRRHRKKKKNWNRQSATSKIYTVKKGKRHRESKSPREEGTATIKFIELKMSRHLWFIHSLPVYL